MRRVLSVIGAGLCSSALFAQEPVSQPVSQPASQPTSQPSTQPFDPDLAAAFAAELTGDSASEPATPVQNPNATRFRMLPDISANGTFVFALFPNGAPDQDLRAHDPTDNGFTLQELEVSLQSIIDPFFRADVFISTGLNEIELEEVFITSLAELPLNMQLRAGQFYTKFGRQNGQHLHIWAFSDLPLTSRRFFGGEGLRDLGLEATVPLPTDRIASRGEFGPPIWTTNLSLTVQQGVNDISFGEKDYSGTLADAATLMYSARLSNFFDLSDTTGLTLGLSSTISSNDTSDDVNNPNYSLLYGADLYLRHKPLQGNTSIGFTAEYMLRQAQLGNNAAAVVTEDALYLQAIARVTRAVELALRFDAVGFVSSVQGEQTIFDDPETASARFLPRDQIRFTAGVSYYTSEFFRLRLHAGYDQSQVLDEDGVIQSQVFPEIMLQANFVIGVHGAHAY
jgi:hypothetical protein